MGAPSRAPAPAYYPAGLWDVIQRQPVSHEASGSEPQIHGREVIKGEYDYPLVALTLRYA